MKRVIILAVLLMLGMVINGCTAAPKEQVADNKPIKSVTAITEVLGDGQKVSAVVLEYDKAIDTAKLKTSDFAVEGKTVTKVYANTAAAKASQGVNGQYVIVELLTAITPDTMLNGNGADRGNSSGNGAGNSAQGSSQNISPPQGGGGPQLGSAATDSAESKPLTVNVTQNSDIATAEGQTYKADTRVMTNSKNINLVVEDFKQLIYTDPNYNNAKLMYNLYVPKNYDPSKKYVHA